MTTFNLPDLGEGLPEADIREWYVNVGDTVAIDTPLVAVETAKALVDVPSPVAGTITKLYGNVGDTICTGQPLVGFDHTDNEAEPTPATDAGTVVGSIPTSQQRLQRDAHLDNTPTEGQSHITPAVRALAKKLHVDISAMPATGKRLTQADIRKFAAQHPAASSTQANSPTQSPPEGFEPLSTMQRAMAMSMTQSQQHVVPITITDDANITSWFKQQDLTLRVIQALIAGCQAEPIINSHFDSASNSMNTFADINLGLAVDTEHGLYVPVIHAANTLSQDTLRETINRYKTQAASKSIPQADLKNATITLSNFGRFAGRYGTPVVSPPAVAILAIGQAFHSPIVQSDQTIASGTVLPLSLTVDHRIITGGQATRFLGAVKESLQSSSDSE